MINIIGTYECKVDAKGRLMFPVAFKNQLSEVIHQGFVIKRSVFQKCLELYPMPEWQNETIRVNKLNKFQKQSVDFIRKFMAGVKTLELDGTGRLLIPKDLIKYGGIEKDIVLSSVVNKIEIWDKEAYEEAVSYDPNDFADLAENVMGTMETD